MNLEYMIADQMAQELLKKVEFEPTPEEFAELRKKAMGALADKIQMANDWGTIEARWKLMLQSIDSPEGLAELRPVLIKAIEGWLNDRRNLNNLMHTLLRDVLKEEASIAVVRALSARERKDREKALLKKQDAKRRARPK